MTAYAITRGHDEAATALVRAAVADMLRTSCAGEPVEMRFAEQRTVNALGVPGTRVTGVAVCPSVPAR